MSYFYTQSHVDLQPHRGIGKRHSQAYPGGMVNLRDQNLACEIEKMGQRPDNKWNELMDPKKQAARHNGKGHVPAPGYTGDNVINEPPAKKVLPRIRQGMSDEQLRRIWAEDDRKAEAQNKMAKGDNMVLKMNQHGTSPINEHIEPHKAGIRVHPRDRAPGAAAVEPVGMKGVGARCDGPPKVYGRRAPTEEDFRLPKYEGKPRHAGVRMAARPKDTLVIG